MTFYVLFFLDLASRTVKIAGATTHAGDAWMSQIARNLTDPEEGFGLLNILEQKAEGLGVPVVMLDYDRKQ